MIERDWLLSFVTLDELEQEFHSAVPRFRRYWEEFKNRLQPGDELWRFESPSETWESFPRMGHAGIAVIRKEEIVDFITTMES